MHTVRRFIVGAAWLAAVPAWAADTPATLTTEPRAVGSFQAVSVRAPVDVVLRQTGREAVEVRAAGPVQPLIETRVVDGRHGRTLEIGLPKGASLPWGAKVAVTVDLASLRSLSVDGSGDVTASGLKSDQLDVAIAGAGDITLKDLQAGELALAIAGSGDIEAGGGATRLSIRISGSGDVDAAALAADEVSVRIAGSGDVEVRPAKTLDVAIAGSGDVVYRGDPTVVRSISGSGTITRR